MTLLADPPTQHSARQAPLPSSTQHPNAGQARPLNDETPILSYAEEYRCPRCDALIPSACVRGRNETNERTGQQTRVVQIYCPHDDAGFMASFRYVDGQLVPLTPPMLMMGQSLTELTDKIAELHGEVPLQAAIDKAADAELERRRNDLALAIARTETTLQRMRARYAAMTPAPPTAPAAPAPANPALPEDKAVLDLDARDCDTAQARLSTELTLDASTADPPHPD